MARTHGRGAGRTREYSFVDADAEVCLTVLVAVLVAVFSSAEVCTFGRKSRQHKERSPAKLEVNVT